MENIGLNFVFLTINTLRRYFFIFWMPLNVQESAFVNFVVNKGKSDLFQWLRSSYWKSTKLLPHSSTVYLPLVKYYFRTDVWGEESHSLCLYSCWCPSIAQLKWIFLYKGGHHYTTNSQSISISQTFPRTHSKTEEWARHLVSSGSKSVWVKFFRMFPVLLGEVKWISVNTNWSL